MNTLFIGLFAVAGVFVVLLLFGLIGPKWLRDKMKQFNRWVYKSNIPPVDPYEPSDKDIL